MNQSSQLAQVLFRFFSTNAGHITAVESSSTIIQWCYSVLRTVMRESEKTECLLAVLRARPDLPSRLHKYGRKGKLVAEQMGPLVSSSGRPRGRSSGILPSGGLGGGLGGDISGGISGGLGGGIGGGLAGGLGVHRDLQLQHMGSDALVRRATALETYPGNGVIYDELGIEFGGWGASADLRMGGMGGMGIDDEFEI